MVILNLYGILFQAVLVFRPEHDFLLKSASSYCVVSTLLEIVMICTVIHDRIGYRRLSFRLQIDFTCI